MNGQSRELILKLLEEKAVLKQEVSDRTSAGFNAIKSSLSAIHSELASSMLKNKTVNYLLNFVDKGEFEAEFSVVDDTLVFLRHSNVFTFESSHEMWKSSYVKDNPSLSFCGKIYIYNFLSDSFKYNRANDVGYLIARIFINKENHFFIEGKRQLGFLYNDFENAVFDEAAVRKVIESCIIYSLDFDPYTPPYEKMTMLTVQEVLDSSIQSKFITGKRLGFRFQQDK